MAGECSLKKVTVTSCLSLGGDCVLIHNNGIIGYSNKIFRNQELGLYYNRHNDYYTGDNKYITYEITVNSKNRSNIENSHTR